MTLMNTRFLLIFAVVLCYGAAAAEVCAQGSEATPPLRVAVLDLGETQTGRRAADHLAAALARDSLIRLVDREQSRAAARGASYAGSLNLTLAEARDLAAAIECDFFITGDAQTLRRSPSSGAIYYEAYASIFIVSARTGKLIRWARPAAVAPTPEEAETSLHTDVQRRAHEYRVAMARAREDELAQRVRELTRASEAPRIEDEPAEGSPAAQNYRPPQPYRRLRPVYTEAAERAEAEATIDASVELDAGGEVRSVEIVRWAGFGLDESVVETVRRLHFRPAMRDGVAFPVRVLLRYNFRRPPKARADLRHDAPTKALQLGSRRDGGRPMPGLKFL
jgi:TonB family protein